MEGDFILYLNQLYTFLSFLFTGFIIGILFDFFRIWRKSFKTLDIITYIQDILFWILTGVILLYSIFKFNNGELRSYIFVGIILGIILYILLFSKYIVKVFTKVIVKIKSIIIYPFKRIFNSKIFKFLRRNINKFFLRIMQKFKRLEKSNIQTKE